jgi:toxin-antitoxin system PIN domain toxin
VILVDVNVLIYARNTADPHHVRAVAWLDDRLNGTARVGLPWMTLLGFLRISTHLGAFRYPLTMSEAWAQVRDWLSADPAWIPQPTERHTEILEQLLGQPGVLGNLVPDAQLAALAIEHGLTLCSTDGDFARFPGLRWENPIAG